jgi:uncharacterized protein HemX
MALETSLRASVCRLDICPFWPCPRRRYARHVWSPVPASPARSAAARAACVVLLLALVAGTGAPAAFSAGVAGGNSFNELTEGGSEAATPTTPTTATTTETTAKAESTSNSQTVILAATGVAIVLLVGIAFVIVRDARRVAPAGDVDMVEARSARDVAVRARKRRAKAKAARQQRKRNR